MRRVPVRAAVAAALLALAACRQEPFEDPIDLGLPQPSALQPQGPFAAALETLWWILFWLSVVAGGFVLAVMAVAIWRRRRDPVGETRGERRFITWTGVIATSLLMFVTMGFTINTSRVVHELGQEGSVEIEVIAYQYWWEIRYPELGVVTANEIHVPVDEPLHFVLKTTDVIHSFWVPQLGGKTDMIPGQTNRLTLIADEPGEYRGQCAEFCGVQHARMNILVIAEERDDFERWVERMRAPAQAVDDPLVARGRELVLNGSCVGCHAIAGTRADAQVGPPLTHVASRRTLLAVVVPNTEEWLRLVVRNTQEVKPGALMPPIPLTDDELDAIVAYLQTLE